MNYAELQAKRDQFEDGDEVIINKHGKVYRGTLVQIFSNNQCQVRLAKGSKVETIGLRHLSKVIETQEQYAQEPPQKLPPAAFVIKRRPREGGPADDLPDEAITNIAANLAVAAQTNVAMAIPVGEVTPAAGDWEAWLSMGAAMANGMQKRIGELEDMEAALVKRSEECLAEALRCAEEAKALRRKHETFLLLKGAK